VQESKDQFKKLNANPPSAWSKLLKSESTPQIEDSNLIISE